MSTEKDDRSKKVDPNPMTQAQDRHAVRNKFGDKIEDVDAQRHPEEQNVDQKLYAPRDKSDLNGPPSNQKT